MKTWQANAIKKINKAASEAKQAILNSTENFDKINVEIDVSFIRQEYNPNVVYSNMTYTKKNSFFF